MKKPSKKKQKAGKRNADLDCGEFHFLVFASGQTRASIHRREIQKAHKRRHEEKRIVRPVIQKIIMKTARHIVLNARGAMLKWNWKEKRPGEGEAAEEKNKGEQPVVGK